jgi:hypothetical protein
VLGVASGSATITYIISNTCGSDTALYGVTINALPDARTISGYSTVCAGASIDLSPSGTGGGTWASSDHSIATVEVLTGVVTGVAAGTVTVTYSYTGLCGTAIATKTITVNALADAGCGLGDVPTRYECSRSPRLLRVALGLELGIPPDKDRRRNLQQLTPANFLWKA